ncbi:MAG: discoidin domain-containing protein [Bacteroidia bacterium]|nr:discoidin domain-containing protein [Bacteroidia bacterium]
MKKIYLLLIGVFVLNISQACDTTSIAKTQWTVSYVDSEELVGEGPNNGHATHCIDNDTATFWHTKWQGITTPYPHEIQINLGAVYPVNGFSFLTRDNNTGGRVKNFHVYLSNDSITWGSPQAAGVLIYPNPNSGAQQTAAIYFGAVNAQYIRLVFDSSYSGIHVMCAELNVFQDLSCGATGQNNQIISLNPVPKQSTVSTPITLTGTTTSGLPISYSIVSGPATINGDTLTLTGATGTVMVQADQAGNALYYPASAQLSFDVIDLTTYFPAVSSKLTGDYDLEMPQLYPYLLHTNASIAEPTLLSIASVEYNINGVVLNTIYNDGDYQVWWTPPAYGNYTIYVTATGNNGNTDVDTINLNVTNTFATQNAQTITNGVIDMGTIGSQWFYGTYTLPQSVGVYDSIVANLHISCPAVPGGCDDWDRLAWVEFKAPNGEWMELFRYITPYRVACNHQIDVTDYASVLQGEIELRMYIETWGTGGWQINLDFDYYASPPAFLYSTIEQLWKGNYNFGNPLNLQPMDTVVIKPYSNVSKATFRLVTTGHGWGSNNTGNAAEFYHAIHDLKINNVTTFTQDLWTDCNPNPDGCTGQQGTWQYNRAGWCPGTIPKPYFYDLTPYLSQAPFNFEYIFQTSYQDICHPNNPACVSGVTCANCNDGYNPSYRIGGYLIRYSNLPLVLGVQSHNPESELNLNFDIYPNPASGFFYLVPENKFGNTVCSIHNISGETLRTYYFNTSEQLAAYSFNLSGLSKGVYFVRLQSEKNRMTKKIMFQ